MLLDTGRKNIDLNCDTLVINTDDQTLALIYRAAISTDPNPDPNGWVTLRDAQAAKDDNEESSANHPRLEQAS